MKGYFWHKLKETGGKYQYRKDGEKRRNKRNRELSDKEEFYRAMALKKSVLPSRYPNAALSARDAIPTGSFGK